MSGQLAKLAGRRPYLAAQASVDVGNWKSMRRRCDELAALGYIKTRPDDGKADERPDPKDQVVQWEMVQKAIHLKAQGDPLTAITMLEQRLAEVPGDIYARSDTGGAYLQVGETERALTHYQLAIEREPNNESLHMGVAGIFLRQGKTRGSGGDDRPRRLEIEPEAAHAYPDARTDRTAARARGKGHGSSIVRPWKWTLESPGPAAYNAMGMLHLVRGRFDEAREAYRNAIRLDSLNGSAHDGLANILIHEGQLEAAMQELQLALRFDPNQARALATLASLLSQQGRPAAGAEGGRAGLEGGPQVRHAAQQFGPDLPPSGPA